MKELGVGWLVFCFAEKILFRPIHSSYPEMTASG
jgi:hypothetical protein